MARIAILGSNYPPTGGGGVTTSHHHLFLMLKKDGHDCAFYTFQDFPADQHHDLQNQIYRFGSPRLLRQIVKGICKFWFLLFEKKFSRFVRAYQTADILNSARGVFALQKSLNQFKPDIIIVPDHSCPAVFLRKPAGSKIITIAHHNPMRFVAVPGIPTQSRKDAEVAIALENLALQKTDLVVSPSIYMRGEFKKTYRYTGPIEIIPHTLDQNLIEKTSPNDLHETLGLPKSAPIVYIPAVGNPFKGNKWVPEIVKRISKEVGSKKIGFYLASTTEILNDLRIDLTDHTGNSSVFFGDRIPYSTHLSYVKGCSLGISCTSLESFGMTILEAQSLGVPMVAYRAQAVSEVIEDGHTGRLVQDGDLNALISETIKTIQAPDSFTDQLGLKILQQNNTICKRKWASITTLVPAEFADDSPPA